MYNKNNILLTSASRHVNLIKRFKEGFKKENIQGKIIAADIDNYAPSLYLADKSFLLPKTSDNKYFSFLEQKCKDEDITVLISARDEELMFYAQNRKKIEKMGIRLILSNTKAIEICNSKIKTNNFFEENQIPCPGTTSSLEYIDKLNFPIVVKENKGAGSRNIFFTYSVEEAKIFTKKMKEPVFQEYVNGQEYTTDLYSTLEGKIIGVVPRKRLQTIGGESYKGITINDEDIVRYCKIIATKLKTIGHINIQCIKNNDEIKFIEINPRFGGGSSLSFMAGLDSPRFLIKELSGKKVEPISNIKWNYSMLRYCKDLYLEVKEKPLVRTILFDMDETLYPEYSYVISGFESVSKYLESKEGINKESILEDLKNSFNSEGRGKNFDIIIKKYKLDDSLLEDLIKQYRNHKPNIQLSPEIKKILIELKKYYKLGLITDGIPIVQRNKVKALGLDKIMDSIIFSQELGGIKFEKPHEKPYVNILESLNTLPEETIFIGDNPEKDFPGAKKLGIKTIRINKGKYENKKSSSLTVDYEIQNLNELFSILNSGGILYMEKEDNCL